MYACVCAFVYLHGVDCTFQHNYYFSQLFIATMPALFVRHVVAIVLGWFRAICCSFAAYHLQLCWIIAICFLANSFWHFFGCSLVMRSFIHSTPSAVVLPDSKLTLQQIVTGQAALSFVLFSFLKSALFFLLLLLAPAHLAVTLFYFRWGFSWDSVRFFHQKEMSALKARAQTTKANFSLIIK